MRIIAVTGAAAALASGAAAQGMTIEQIGAAAQGAPMNGGVVAVTPTEGPGGVRYYMATIPNSELRFGVGGIGCSAETANLCQGLGMIFVAGQRSQANDIADQVNGSAPYVKFFRTDSASVMTAEQILVGGDASTVRQSIAALENGIARLIEALTAAPVQISAEPPPAHAPSDGPPVRIVLTDALGAGLSREAERAEIEAALLAMRARSE